MFDTVEISQKEYAIILPDASRGGTNAPCRADNLIKPPSWWFLHY
jgi:hypothetical protein